MCKLLPLGPKRSALGPLSRPTLLTSLHPCWSPDAASCSRMGLSLCPLGFCTNTAGLGAGRGRQPAGGWLLEG